MSDTPAPIPPADPDDAATLLEQGVTEAEALAAREEAGDCIGRYKLLQKLGEGGCGTVFMAEQEVPVRRRVALKVIKLGMDTRQVVARFEAERQALAMMDHPNIARVLDAGATETGRPYFVMELVRGVKITEYCDDAKLDARERLGLFTQVCAAIQHAHQKGIIHRDIKPSNILVTLHDGVPVPKVIDFGIAKATQQQLTDKTLFTELRQFIGTPAYMSPEQAELSGLDIDTRSDIYSLGVLLYELLTGRPPFDPAELAKSGLDEMRRRIREDEPPRPSTRISTLLDAELTEVASRRHAPAPQLAGLLRGDLDWIVMKCLEKDRARRYETANGLALDIKRFLANEPVLARPPSAGYRLAKFARRHQVGLAAGAAVLLAVLLGLGFSTWSFFQERRARARAESAEQDQSRSRVQAETARQKAEAAQAMAETQRQRAEEERGKAEQNELFARRSLYAADMNLAQQSLKANNLGRARRLLDRHRPAVGVTNLDLRGWEWRYLWRQCRSDALFSLASRPPRVMSLGISHDGALLAAGFFDGWVGIWDRNTRQLTQVPQTNGRIAYVAFSPVERRLAIVGWPGTVRLLDLATQQETRLGFDIEGAVVNTVAFSPDGRMVAALGNHDRARGGRLRVWDARTARVIQTMEVDFIGNLHFGRLVFSADSQTVFAGGVGKVFEAWRVADGVRLWQAKVSEDRGLTAVAASPDGAVVVTASAYADDAVRIWSASKGELIAKLAGHTAWVGDFRFSADGRRLLTAAADHTLRLWDTTTWQEVAVLRGHGDEVHAAAFTPDGRFVASGSKDGEILLWNLATSPDRSRAYRFPSETRWVSALAGSSSALLLRERQTPAIMNLATREIRPLALPAEGYYEYQSDNQMFHYDGEKWLTFHRLGDSGSRELGRVDVGPKLRGGASWPATGLVAYGNGTARIEVTGINSFDRRRTLDTGDSEIIEPVRFFNGGRHLVALGEKSSLHVWNVVTGESPPELGGLAASPRLAANDRTLVFFGLEKATGVTGLYFCDFSGATNPVSRQPFPEGPSSIALSPDGRLAAAGIAGARAMIYDSATGTRRHTLHGHMNSVSGLNFSPDSSRLATGSGGHEAVKLWDLATGQEVLNLSDPAYLLGHIHFSDDGNTLIVGSRQTDSVWLMWRAPSWAEIEKTERDEGTWRPAEP